MEQHFKILLERYLAGELSASERADFINLISSGQHAHELDQFIEHVMQYGHFDMEENEEIKNLLYQRLQGSVLAPSVVEKEQPIVSPVHRVHFLRTTWLRYAAAVVLVFGAIAFYFFYNNKKTDQALVNGNKPLPTKILPGRDRAVLTLGNGHTVILDSAQGDIVQQGNFKAINLSGKLDYKGQSGSVEYHTLSTPRGGQYQLALPDGSMVWLNAASSVTYPTAFTGPERKVQIRGEAYFEVTPDKTKPFIVDVDGKSVVQVLGTHFNINSYEDDGTVKATLLEGSVRVDRPSGSSATENNTVILKPGQQAVLTVHTTAVAGGSSSSRGSNDGQNDIVVTSHVDLDKVMAWKNGLFNFDGANVPAVMHQLERWYDIQVKYEGAVPDILFQGKLNRRVSFTEMLEILPAVGIKYRLEGRTLVVKQ